MQNDYLKKCKQYYEENIQNGQNTPKGCSQSEIQDIENKNNISLPLSYKQYLSWMGKDKEGVFVGSNIFFDDIASNNKHLEGILKECCKDFQHKGDPLCFYNHQGYIYGWFYIPSDTDNPTCYILVDEGSDSIVKEVGKFSDFILGGLEALG